MLPEPLDQWQSNDGFGNYTTRLADSAKAELGDAMMFRTLEGHWDENYETWTIDHAVPIPLFV